MDGVAKVIQSNAVKRDLGRVGERTPPLRKGDLVRWNDCFATVDNVTTFRATEAYVTVRFFEKRGRAGRTVCLRLADLVDAEIWHFAGRVTPSPEVGE